MSLGISPGIVPQVRNHLGTADTVPHKSGGDGETVRRWRGREGSAAWRNIGPNMQSATQVDNRRLAGERGRLEGKRRVVPPLSLRAEIGARVRRGGRSGDGCCVRGHMRRAQARLQEANSPEWRIWEMFALSHLHPSGRWRSPSYSAMTCGWRPPSVCQRRGGSEPAIPSHSQPDNVRASRLQRARRGWCPGRCNFIQDWKSPAYSPRLRERPLPSPVYSASDPAERAWTKLQSGVWPPKRGSTSVKRYHFFRSCAKVAV